MDKPIDWLIQCVPHNNKAVILSGGPTITDKNHPLNEKLIKEIRILAKKKDHYIFCVKHSHDKLIDLGIIPYACFLLDPRDHVQDFIRNPHPDVKYFVASMCAPSTWNRLIETNSTIIGYDASVGAHEDDVIRRLKKDEDAVDMVGGGSTAAARGFGVLTMLGFRDFICFGYDSCFWEEPKNKSATKPDGSPKYLQIEVAGRSFWTDGELIAQSQDVEAAIKSLTSATFDFRGDGMCPHVASVLIKPKPSFTDIY